MVKFVLIFVLLAIGYNDINSVLAKTPNDLNIISDVVEDQLLPMKQEDYQNDVDPFEGSGDPFYEVNIPPNQIEDTDKTPPDITQDTVAKEQDQRIVEESKEQQEDLEEKVPVPQVVEEDQSFEGDEIDNTNTNESSIDGSSIAQDNTSNSPDLEEQVNVANVDVSNASNAPVSEEDTTNAADLDKLDVEQDTSKTEVSNEQDAIEARNESQNDTNEDTEENESSDKANIQDKSDTSSGELESQETVQENDTRTDQDGDEHASQSVVNRKFPFEKGLPAERFGNMRGLGKSMPMQEAKSSDDVDVKTVEEKPVEVEQKVEDIHNHENEKESPQLPEMVDENKVDRDNLEEQKDVDDVGASSASSGSNTITFVVILGIVCLVGIIGYFVHKRRNRQRATPVPTYEDRELKEVKTHRPNDNSGDRKPACHIPEANPLILNNSHFKQTTLPIAEVIPKNGHLPSAEQQQQQLLTTLLVTKPKEDDIRMMDDDVEEEKAEQRPLVMSSFKPSVKTEEIINKYPREDVGRVIDGERIVTSVGGD